MDFTSVAVTNPFPGLRPFYEEEEYLFFGRERQVDAMVNKLADTRFLAVVGTSGSGKSSLVNCGLRPALHRGLMTSAGTAWRVAQFRPGSDPLGALARTLAREDVLYTDYEGDIPLIEIIDTTLRMSKRGLLDVYRRARLPEHANLLVVVDQFEELFRFRKLAASENDAAPATDDAYGVSEETMAFVNLLLEVQEHADLPVYVVLTMRSDFLGDCAQFQGLPEAINAGQFLVPRMTRAERRAAIAGPVGVGGARIAPILLTRLVNDVGDNPDQLSILQHALNRTWAQWQKDGKEGPLDLSHYEAIGTMAQALDQHAEEAYAALKTERKQKLCEKLFKALTDKGTDARGIRRPTKLGTLRRMAEAPLEEVVEVIEVFRDPSRSFLMPPVPEDLTVETVIDISHESLMRVWRRLKAWADEEAEAARRYRRLAERAQQRDYLGGPQLQLELDWWAKKQPTEAWAALYGGGFQNTMDFLENSKAEQERKDQEEAAQLQRERKREQELAAEQARADANAKSKRRLSLLAAGLAVAVLVAAFFAYNASRERVIAEKLAGDVSAVRESLKVALQETATASSPNGQFVVTTSPEGKVTVLDMESGAKSILPPEESGKVTALSFSPVGKTHLVTGSATGRVCLWAVDPFEALSLDTVLVEQGEGVSISKVIFSPNGKRLAAARGKELWLWSWSPEPLQINYDTTYRYENRAVDLRFSPNSESIIGIDTSNQVTSLGDLIVVVSGDDNLEEADWEINKARQEGYRPTLYHKRGMYRTTLGPFLTLHRADSSRNAVRAIWSDAYVVNLKTWCPQRKQEEGYVECSTQIADRQQLIVDMFSDDRNTRRSATARIVDCCTSDAQIMLEALRYAREHPLNSMGVINTLHFFLEVDPELLRENENQLNGFLDEAERNGGPQADAYVDRLRRQLQ